MNTIWKYPIEIKYGQFITIPDCAIIRYVGLDTGDRPCIWCQVDTDNTAKVSLEVVVVGTGHHVPLNLAYIGSFRDRAFIWHIYARRENLVSRASIVA